MNFKTSLTKALALPVLFLAANYAPLNAAPVQSGDMHALNVAAAVQGAVQDAAGEGAHISVVTTDDKNIYLYGRVKTVQERQDLENLAQPFIEGYRMHDEVVVTGQVLPRVASR